MTNAKLAIGSEFDIQSELDMGLDDDNNSGVESARKRGAERANRNERKENKIGYKKKLN